MNAKRSRAVIGSILLIVAILCVIWFINAPRQVARVSTTLSTGSPAAVKAKAPDVPDWADNASHWKFETDLGPVGLTKMTGGQLSYGWYYGVHLGPFGNCTLQGPKFKFLRGPHTKKALVALAIVSAAASLGVLSCISQRKRKEL